MKISVIIPCYNAQAYLAQCLDSLLCQSLLDFEAIVIDDGSTDNTARILLEYAQKDARIHLIRQENAGVSAARNAGLSAARGEWVLFVDADDLLPNDSLETLLSHATENTDMVVALHETFGESSETRIEYPQTLWMSKKGDARRQAAALRLIEGDALLNIMCNKLHRRAFLQKEGIVLTPGIRIAEDALFNLEAVLCAKGITFCDQVTYCYRIHAASATQTRDSSEFNTHLPWFKAMAEMMRKRNVFETYYAAYFSSVVLRLYKDGGVGGVMRDFAKKAKPLLAVGLEERRLPPWGRMLWLLCKKEIYAGVYPFIYPFEVLNRKLREAAFALRVRRNKRG